MKMKKRLVVPALTAALLAMMACAPTEEEKVNEPVEEELIETAPADDAEESDNEKTPDEDVTDEPAEEPVDEGVQLDLEEDILNPESLAVLVNKSYYLTAEDAPTDLVLVEVKTVLESVEIRQMRQVAADALKDMFDAAEADGIILHARSGYRSYQTQTQLFNNYVENNGEEAANRYSARPGQSEHQTGLSMDVTSESANYQLTEAFGETEEGIWVKENADQFGFIIRYPEGKEDITGYIFEPWHLRYLGEDLAKDVYESGLTYEEYLMEGGVIDAITE